MKRAARISPRLFALLGWAICTPTLEGHSPPPSLMLGAARASASSAAGAAGADAPHLPASWEGNLPGADGTVHWHLDLLPEQRYRLRRTHEGKPAPNSFDEIGRWTSAADGSRLDLYVAGEKRVQFRVEADGSLRKLDTGGNPTASGLSDRLERLPQPELIEPRLKSSGLFIYMADAGVITLCADGSRLPVAKEGDFRALEAAYLKARPALGEALLASVEGRIVSRPSMEESLPPRDTLVVERFISLSRHRSCGRAVPTTAGTDYMRERRRWDSGANLVCGFTGKLAAQRTGASGTGGGHARGTPARAEPIRGSQPRRHRS